MPPAFIEREECPDTMCTEKGSSFLMLLESRGYYLQQQMDRRTQKKTAFRCVSITLSLHGIAECILGEMERSMQLPPNWFQQNLGPTATSSQWHMKRYVADDRDYDDGEENRTKNEDKSGKADVTESGRKILLPMHTDPSLISVVIHDTSSLPTIISECGAKEFDLGLQYFDTKQSKWIDLNTRASDDFVLLATIFAGSVLSHITERTWPAAKHRVVGNNNAVEASSSKQRMAATLFVRPQLSALLPAPLPSPFIAKEIEARKPQQSQIEGKHRKVTKPKLPITFEAWLRRVAKNYEKKKEKQFES
ncbi:MAG: hypothetical protein SGARI_005106 [Bacillariaceae sp.]